MRHRADPAHRFALLSLALAVAAACGGTPTTPTPTPNTCSFAVTPSAVVLGSSGQTATVHVETGAGCAWTARGGADWIAVSPASGSGAGDVVLTATANESSAERAATATIATRDVAVRQAGRDVPACTYTLTSSSNTFGADGGRGRVSLTTAAGCAWTARSLAAWLTLLTTAGTGPADIEFTVAPFDGTSQRQTTIAVEQATFSIRQDPPAPAACTYAVDPTNANLHWHGVDGLEIRVTTGTRCTWTADTGAGWIELLTTGSGTGSATIRVRVSSHTAEATRSAPLMIRWPTETAGQNVWFAQEGCRYALGPSSQDVPAAGGVFRASVFGDPVSTSCPIGCPWQATASAAWIHLSGNGSGAGDDQLTYTVDPNTTGVLRTATITVSGRTLTVNQAR